MNRIHAMFIDMPAMPVNPISADTSAMMRKTSAQ